MSDTDRQKSIHNIFTGGSSLCPARRDQITHHRKFSPNLKSFFMVFLMSLSILAITLIIICSQVVTFILFFDISGMNEYFKSVI